MGDENVVLYDETSPLEQTRKSILYYNSRPEETTTYLVELPEKRIDAPRPSTLPQSRPRRSTIVNVSQLPDTTEAEERPLEDYVRRNLPSFRKSLTPEDVQRLTADGPAQGRDEGREVVRPATAEDIERDLMDNKKRKKSENGYEERGRLPEEKAQNRRQLYQRADFAEPKTRNQQKVIRFENPERIKVENAKKEHRKSNSNKNTTEYPKNEVVVMPALEPVSVSQKSPFFKTEQSSSPPPKNRPVSPIKVRVSVESSDERLDDGKQGQKHRSERGKNSRSPTTRKSSTESDEESSEEDNDLTKKKHKKMKHRPNPEYPSRDSEESKKLDEKVRGRRRKEKPEEAKRGKNESRNSSGRPDKNSKRKSLDKTLRSRSSSVCLSGDSGESEPNIVNRPSKKEKHQEMDTSHKRTSRDKKISPPSSAKRGRKSDDIVDYSKTKNPFGKEEPYSVHYVVTKPDASKGKKTGKDSKAKGGDEKMISVKAPRSATKVVAMRRYHIQIPEHGRPETWFNVRFNMNAENNVDMNYEGPVKINNYYASNNYT